MTISANSSKRWRLSESQREGGGSLSNDGNGTAAKAIACRQTPSPTSTTKFLIANLELEFRVSPIRITDLRFSNRKFFAISCLAFQPSSTHIHTSAASSFSVQRRASSLQNLIETPRLEFRATPTKQSSLPISNRDKNALFAPQMPAMVGIPRSTLVVSLSLTQETQ